jgi:hypothetical protein
MMEAYLTAGPQAGFMATDQTWGAAGEAVGLMLIAALAISSAAAYLVHVCEEHRLDRCRQEDSLARVHVRALLDLDHCDATSRAPGGSTRTPDAGRVTGSHRADHLTAAPPGR